MDRAEKVRRYRKKMAKNRMKRSQRLSKKPMAGLSAAGLASAIVLAAGILAAFFIILHKKGAASSLDYVTREEFASLMSFLSEDSLTGQWEENAGSAVTGGQLKAFIKDIGLSGIVVPAGNNAKLSRANLAECYEQILDYLDLAESVRKETILLLSMDQGNRLCGTKDGELRLNISSLKLECMHTYDAYLMGDTLLGIAKESDKTIALRDVLAKAVTGNTVTFEYGGKEYQAACPDTDGLNPEDSCTLCIKGGKITKIKDAIHPSGKGQGGTKNTQEIPSTVDVLLLNSGNIHRSQVYLTSDSGCKVKQDKKTKAYKPNNCIQIKKLKIRKGKSITAEPAKKDGKLFLADKNGNPISNGYYGTLTIYRDKEGYYIVNKVNIEKYLYSVVASEMPSSFGIEALKAQAVCARSYVYRQMASEDYSSYHAQIDDSTNYQVYNKSEINGLDIQAVEETAGKVMYAQGGIINAYYFSSSCGYTSSMEIWNQPESDYPYLKAKSLNPSAKGTGKIDMSDEASFKKFITSKKAAAYDSSSRYFRWDADVEFSACINELKEKIKQRQKINPDNFTFYSTTGKKPKKASSLKGFGGFKKMQCIKRGKSGAVLELALVFEFGKAVIKSEYNIRSIVGCALEQITYADGTTDSSLRFLPSAYFTASFDKKSRRYRLSGGGNGHGMGLSQYGAASMAKEGWDYKEILQFYYDGIEVKKIDEGNA